MQVKTMETATEQNDMIEVSTEFPVIKNHPCRIAFIGTCPSRDDEITKRPFSGTPGTLLGQAINAAGILRSASLMGYISSVNIAGFNLNSWQIQDGKARLRRELEEYKPNLIVVIGDIPLKLAGEPHSSEVFRGSLFKCVDQSSPFYGYKCLSTISPADAMRRYDLFPLLCFDINRAKEEGESPDLNLPIRHFELHPTTDEIIRYLNEWPPNHPAAIDIEGGCKSGGFSGITCMSVATSPYHAFIIDWKNMRDIDRPRIYDAVRAFLKNPMVPKSGGR